MAKKKEDKTNLEIIAIVGIVAIVAIFVLYLDNSQGCQSKDFHKKAFKDGKFKGDYAKTAPVVAEVVEEAEKAPQEASGNAITGNVVGIPSGATSQITEDQMLEFINQIMG
ncbi:MAG: hypothetical protein QF915_03785 [Candidatus Woesearchaeota archaeon]|jgi:FtsZ-interacting cell division protein ZipA|nr:hypothetical protein [Candidatus Woesearchaeota archaeon]MDP7458263.1 hypothetical protein [Candidatus Woesearchaeota archaeon]